MKFTLASVFTAAYLFIAAAASALPQPEAGIIARGGDRCKDPITVYVTKWKTHTEYKKIYKTEYITKWKKPRTVTETCTVTKTKVKYIPTTTTCTVTETCTVTDWKTKYKPTTVTCTVTDWKTKHKTITETCTVTETKIKYKPTTIYKDGCKDGGKE